MKSIAHRKPRTQRDYKKMLDKRLMPTLGKKKLSDITYESVTEITDKFTPSVRSHVLAVARAFLNWCVRPPRRYIAHSPLEGVQILPSKKRKRTLKSAELKQVWRAAETQGYPYGTIIQLLIATGQRRGEIGNLMWPWINEKDRIIVLPEWVTKELKGARLFHTAMLSLGFLLSVPRRNTTDLLFPSTVSEERPLSGWSKYKKQLKDGVEEKWSLHDLRRTYRSAHGEIGTPREIGERLINHVAGVTTDVELIYDVWTYLPEMRQAVASFESHLQHLLARI